MHSGAVWRSKNAILEHRARRKVVQTMGSYTVWDSPNAVLKVLCIMRGKLDSQVELCDIVCEVSVCMYVLWVVLERNTKNHFYNSFFYFPSYTYTNIIKTCTCFLKIKNKPLQVFKTFKKLSNCIVFFFRCYKARRCFAGSSNCLDNFFTNCLVFFFRWVLKTCRGSIWPLEKSKKEV